MASVDGSRSLQGASDELYDIVCGPCQTDRLHKKANYYCNECREYLCNSCKDVHRKLAILKSHTVLSGNQIPAGVPSSRRSGFVAFCGCNKNQEVDFFCEDHQDVICNPCKKVKHRKCKTLDVQQKCADYTPTRLNSVLTKTKSLIHEFDSMQKHRKSDRNELKRITTECRMKIKQFRASIDAYLDKLEQSIFQELDEFDQQQAQYIDQHISELKTGLQMLNADNQQLEDAKHKANKIKMFTTDVQVSKSLQAYEAMLAEMENDAPILFLSFEGNKKLAGIQTEITSLGSLKGTGQALGLRHTGEKKSNKTILLGKKATLQKKVNIRSSGDEKHPWISACTFMPSGHAVLCDYSNSNVKLLDKDLVLRQHLKLCCCPWDVSVVDDNNAIITLPDTQQLQYIQVFPQLKAGRTIQLDKECYGIEVFGDEIYTTQYDVSGQGEVLVLDLNGNRKRMLRTDVKFYEAYYITVSSSGKIFVSGGFSGAAAVTCMTTDGNLVYQYKDKELRYPRGMYVDAEDNILVCDPASDTVQVITANGKKYGTLLSPSDGIVRPLAIAYRETDDTLLVGGENQDHVSIYKLV